MDWPKHMGFVVSANIIYAASRYTTEVEALATLTDVTKEEITAAVIDGEGNLTEAQLDALDHLGNGNGYYDLGDLLKWLAKYDDDTEGGTLPPSAALFLIFAIPARRGRAVLALAAAALLTACGTDRPAGVASEDDSGYLAVELTAPVGNRDIGLTLDLEGPGIGDLRLPDGLDLLYRTSPQADVVQMVIAGQLPAGAVLHFHVPDRNRLSLYSAEVWQVVAARLRAPQRGRLSRLDRRAKDPLNPAHRPADRLLNCGAGSRGEGADRVSSSGSADAGIPLVAAPGPGLRLPPPQASDTPPPAHSECKPPPPHPPPACAAASSPQRAPAWGSPVPHTGSKPGGAANGRSRPGPR